MSASSNRAEAAQTQALGERLTAAPLLPPRMTARRVIEAELLSRLRDAEEADRLRPLLSHAPTAALVAGLLAHSPFLSQIMRRHPDWLAAALESRPEARRDALLAQVAEEAAAASDMAALMPPLRRFRSEMALLIALADCGGVWGIDEVTETLTATADMAVRLAVDHLLHAAADLGRISLVDPADPGRDSGLVVLALGKHGSRELNYSSDIDISVFFDPAKAEARGVAEPSSFFVKLTQNLARLLQERTSDGYVFRVDLRLRPDPGSTPVAVSLPTAYAYYETVGQNWERAAMIKARPVAGDLATGRAFIADLVPFVWRKYFDFAAIADIHAMKRQIQAVKGHEVIAVAGHDVKLGRGGIREIEFFVQTQQLVFGGRRPVLRGARTVDMLGALQAEGWISVAARDELRQAYAFLRTLEHRLQMRHDEQTQRLPVDPGDLAGFARFCGYPTLKRFEKAVIGQARRVEAHYALLFEEGPSLASEAGTLSFTGAAPDPETVATLGRLGYRAPEAAAETVRGWHFGRRAAVTSARAREVLTELTPALLVAFGRTADPDAALAGLDGAFGRMPAAVELLSILRSHENLLGLFAEILGSAPRLARIVATNPHVLDGLIDPAFGDARVDPAGVLARMRAQVGEPPPSFEDALDRLRDAARQENFLVGARLLSGVYAAGQAGSAYAAVADAAVAIALAEAGRELSREHGAVPGARVAVLGLGRLGARDLTASSDLDLVVIYDLADSEARSDGARPLDPVVYHQRLTQRLVTALTAPTRRGLLYDVDLRLRPAGSKGPIAVRLAGFSDYQRSEADLWEHMALTKARAVAGDAGLAADAMRVIAEVLMKPRDEAQVRREAVAMRQRIADAKGTRNAWDLKLAPGGLTDIEFIEQALVLGHAASHPTLVAGGNAALGAAAEAGLIAASDAAVLIDAHRLFDEVTHWQRFSVDGVFDPAALPVQVMRRIAAVASAPDARVLAAMLDETRSAVREIWARVMV